MDEHTFRPGSIIFTDGPPMVIRQPAFKIRVTGPDIDISLAVICQEDIEIIEKLLAKLRASVSADAQP